VASRCTEIPISGASNGMKLPRLDEKSRADGSRFGGVTGYWLAEAAQISGTKGKLATTELNLKKVAALVYATDELLADSAALSAWVSRVASAELAWQVDNRIIRGSGAGCPLGIVNAGATIEVPKEANQVADSVVVENILKMYSRLPAGSDSTAVWYTSKSVMTQLYGMGLVVGLGGTPIFMPAGGISGKPYNTLLGLPVIPIEHAAKLGDKGDLILADMPHYLLATKGGVQAAASIHVEFLTDQTCFRFVLRVDGQPDGPSPITPWNGGPTESPFLVLQSR
jgi:HK97 family phage major capsid protein